MKSTPHAVTVKPAIVMLLETVISISVSVEPFIVRPALPVTLLPKTPRKFTSLVTTDTLPLAISNKPAL